jgi:hypothetical protein
MSQKESTSEVEKESTSEVANTGNTGKPVDAGNTLDKTNLQALLAKVYDRHTEQLSTINADLSLLKAVAKASLDTGKDPREENAILPNDAKLTMQYGARAYVTDLYPGYVWRNGVWYKHTATLKFVIVNLASLHNKILNTYTDTKTSGGHYACDDEIYVPTATMGIDDTFDAIFINDIRTFAKRVYNFKGQVPAIVDPERFNEYWTIYNPTTKQFVDRYIDKKDTRLEHSYMSSYVPYVPPAKK